MTQSSGSWPSVTDAAGSETLMPPARTWTPADDAVALDPSLSRRHAARRLGVAERTLKKRELALGQVRSRSKGGKGDDLVRSLWGLEPHKIIADRAGLAGPDSVGKVGRRLGLRILRRREWSVDQRKWAVAHVGDLGSKRCAKHLGCSLGAFRTLLWREGVAEGDLQEELGIQVAAGLLGVDRTTVTGWINRKTLAVSGTKARRRVSPTNLRQFVMTYPEKVNLKMIGKDAWLDLVALLCGRW